MDLQQLYKKLIYNRCQDLLASGIEVEIWNNFDLAVEKLLFNWLRSQRSNYKNKKYGLKDPIKYELFGNYMKENKEYF